MTYSTATKNLFDGFIEMGAELHALTVYKNGEKILSVAPAPYSVYQKNHVYSLSKSFCSTAIGIACDMGYLSLDEKIIDIFPDKCPENISENLSKMTLLNVLSMNTGHAGCVMNTMMRSDDPVAAFLSCDVPFAPGTHFAYNTGATCLAGACLTARTGLSVHEFLNVHLFPHMGIKETHWLSHHGISEGGVGLHISSEDAAKLALLYLDGGIFNGKRLISEEYVKLAGSLISDNSGNGTIDWCSGYGLQFWRCAKGGFRGDGAFGQVSLILPHKNIAIGAICEVGAMQPEIDLFCDFAEKIENCNDAGDEKNLLQYLDTLYSPESFDVGATSLVGKQFILDENISKFGHIFFDKNEKGGIDISITSKGSHTSLLSLVPEKWTYGRLYGDFVTPTLTDLTATFDVTAEFFACAKNDGENLSVTLRGINCPHRMTYIFEPTDGGIKISRKTIFNEGYKATFNGKEI